MIKYPKRKEPAMNQKESALEHVALDIERIIDTFPSQSIPPETTIDALEATRDEAIKKLKAMKNEYGLEVSRLQLAINVLDYEIMGRRCPR